MNEPILTEITKLLRKEGFTGIKVQKSSVTNTLSAEREDQRLVVHLGPVAELPTSTGTRVLTAVKSSEITMKAGMPGIRQMVADVTNPMVLQSLRQGASAPKEARD